MCLKCISQSDCFNCFGIWALSKKSEQHEIFGCVVSHCITYKYNELKLYWLEKISIKAL